jgi:hypothetical protein
MFICSKGRTDTATTMETSPVRRRRNSRRRHEGRGRGSGSRHDNNSKHRSGSSHGGSKHRSGFRRSNSSRHRSGSSHGGSKHRSGSRHGGSKQHRLSDSVMTFHQAGKKFNTDLTPAQGTLLATWLGQNPQTDSRKIKDKKWEKLLGMFHSGFDKKFTRDFYWCSFPLIAPKEYWDNNPKSGINIEMSGRIGMSDIITDVPHNNDDTPPHKVFNFFKRSHIVDPENWNATRTPVQFKENKLKHYGTGPDILKQIMLHDGGRNSEGDRTRSVMEMLEAVVTFMFYIFHGDPFARESSVTDVAVAWPFFHQPRVCATIPLFHDYPNNPVWDRFPFQDERNTKFRELIRQNHKTGGHMNVPESLIPKLKSGEKASADDKVRLKKLYTSEYKKDSVWGEWKKEAKDFEGMFRGITSIIEVVLRDSITDGSRFPTRVDMGLPDYREDKGLLRDAQIIGVRKTLGEADLPGDKVLTSGTHGSQYMHGLPRERLPPPQTNKQRRQEKAQQRKAEAELVAAEAEDTGGTVVGGGLGGVITTQGGGVPPGSPLDPYGTLGGGGQDGSEFQGVEGSNTYSERGSRWDLNEIFSPSLSDLEQQAMFDRDVGSFSSPSFLQSKTNSKVFKAVQQLAERIHKERANSKSPMQVSPLALLEDMLGSNAFHQTKTDQNYAWDMALGVGQQSPQKSSKRSRSPRKPSKRSRSPRKPSKGSRSPRKPSKGSSRKSTAGDSLGFENHSFDYLVVYYYHSNQNKEPVTLDGYTTPYSMEWVREQHVSGYDSYPLWKSQGEALLANGYEFPDDGGFFMPVQVPGTRMVRFRTGGSSKDRGKTGKGVYYSILP